MDQELPPGYSIDPKTGAWVTLPWPGVGNLPPSLGPLVIAWAENDLEEQFGADVAAEFGPGLIHHLTGQPWQFTPGQRRFLYLYYAFDPETGRYLYRSAVKRGSKGTGKDIIAAAHGNIELVGPSLLVQDASGNWTGVPHRMALVQIASNSEAQSKDTLRVASAMWSREAREWHGLDCGETRIIKKDTGGRFEVLTASEASSEGDPASFIILNEALALDTPIPTPDGWTTVEKIEAGDFVLSPDGLPTGVTKTTEVFHGRPCYRVTFRDGDSIIADAGHLWVAERTGTPTKIGALKARTTQEMFESGWTFRVPCTAPVKLPEAELPVDPYVLGAWLGDGCRNSLMFSTAGEDLPWWLEEFARLGVPARHLPNRSRPTAEQFTIAGNPHDWSHRGAGYRALLVKLGIYENKRIPDMYLRGSIDQRLSLLQGLVDTDGCVDNKDGRVIFCNTNKNLADGVAELARSLGHIVHVNCREDNRKESYLPVWRVEWMGDANLPSARMPRKRDRLHVPTSRQLASRWQYIKSIEPVDSVPVKCISVDSADHLFLAGQWKTTHNSHHMTASNGGHRVAEVARRNVGKSPADIQARLVEYTNAHSMGLDSIAEQSYRGWQDQQAGILKNLKKDILYDSIEANPGLDINDPEQLKVAVIQAYSDAPWADLERLADEVMDPRTSHAEAIRFYLNGLALREDAWMDPVPWGKVARPGTVVADGEKIAMFLDCSKSGDATGLVAARIEDGFTFSLGIWQPPKGGRGDNYLVPRHEVDAQVRETFDRYKVMWFGVDPSPATDDDTEALYWADLIDAWHRDFGKKLPLWATPGQSTGHSVKFDMRTSERGANDRLKAFTEQAMQCVEWVENEWDREKPPLTHDADPALTLHVHNARARANKWGVTLGKESRDSKKLVDLAVCMVGAQLGRRLVLNNAKINTGASKPRKVLVNW